MIASFNMSAILSVAAMITALGTAWLTIRKIAKDVELQRKLQSEEILKAARKDDTALRLQLESEIHDLRGEIKVIKEGHQKDMDHLRETYNGEIKFLGQKIEELRSEVRNQHAQLVQLLSKMIDRND
jgi:hypothetical protein